MHSIPIDLLCNLNVLKCLLFLFVRCSFSSMLRTGLGMCSQLSFSNLNLPQIPCHCAVNKEKNERQRGSLAQLIHGELWPQTGRLVCLWSVS